MLQVYNYKGLWNCFIIRRQSYFYLHFFMLYAKSFCISRQPHSDNNNSTTKNLHYSSYTVAAVCRWTFDSLNVLLYIPPCMYRIEWNDYRHQTEQPAAAKVQSQETFWEETSQVSFCLVTCVKRLLYASAHSNPQPLYMRTSIILYVIRHYNTCHNHVNTYRDDVYRETWRVWNSIEIYFLPFIIIAI